MKDIITVAHKRSFIHWFLSNYELKDPSVRWLLQSLASHESLLANVHFTEHLQTDRKAMLISTKCVQMTPFKFYHQKRISTDVEKAFLDVHQHPDHDLYITLYFRNRLHSEEYKMVLEYPEKKSSQILLQRMESLQIELFLDSLVRKDRLSTLKRQIDEALDARDYEQFMIKSSEYRSLLHETE